MRFLEKYELQEPLASGPIELFAAEDTTTGMRRLVHIIECKGASGELTTQRILQLIRHVAPELPGVVLEGGRYKQTAYAYLITTFPTDHTSVQRWVQSYKELRDALPATMDSAIPPRLTPHAGTTAKSKEPSDFTKVFGRAGTSTDEEATAIVSPLPTGAAAKSKETSDFTNVFGRAGTSADEEATAISSSLPKGAATKSKEPGGFTEVFGRPKPSADEEATAIVSPLPTGAVTKSKEPGGFTEVFGRPEPSADGATTAIVSVPPPGSAAKSKEPSDFAKVFGRPTVPQASQTEVSAEPSRGGDAVPRADNTESRNSPGGETRTGDFTRFFRGAAPAPAQEAFLQKGGASTDVSGVWDRTPAQEGQPDTFRQGTRAKTDIPGEFTKIMRGDHSPESPLDVPREQASPKFSEHVSFPSATSAARPQSFTEPGRLDSKIRPVDARPGFSGGIPEPNWNMVEKSEATQVFNPAEHQPPAPAPESTGPSDFTCIVSRPQPPPAPTGPVSAEAPPAIGPGSAPPPMKMPTLQPPPTPAVQAMLPKAPSGAAAGSVPKPTMPNLPSAGSPSAPQATSKLVSYIPLIIVVNVVLLLAIALVLYFALKSH